jgi:hypothetical protein
MKPALLLILAAAFLCCMAASPNILFVAKGGIKAQGTISKQREQIDLIQIDLQRVSELELRDLWVGLSPTNQITFAEVTESVIKETSSTNFVSETGKPSHTYYAAGYSFRFEEGHLVNFQANRYGFPPKKTTAFVKLGSRKSETPLSLPCSVDDFEKVFGKADKITRGFGW